MTTFHHANFNCALLFSQRLVSSGALHCNSIHSADYQFNPLPNRPPFSFFFFFFSLLGLYPCFVFKMSYFSLNANDVHSLLVLVASTPFLCLPRDQRFKATPISTRSFAWYCSVFRIKSKKLHALSFCIQKLRRSALRCRAMLCNTPRVESFTAVNS